MEVLVVGGGGREHALADRLNQSPDVSRIFVAPGNAGTNQFADNLPHLTPAKVPEILRFAQMQKPALTIVGSEDALAMGIVDRFTAEKLRIFGPTKGAAMIETSKAFAKREMHKAEIPTAHHKVFGVADHALAYIDGREYPQVIKSSEPKEGKGVTICNDYFEASEAVYQLEADDNKIVVEDFLEGFEISLHAISDGESYRMFPVAKDHKTRFENNKGPMTGGMGMIAPIEGVDSQTLGEQIIAPLLEHMSHRGTPFKGIIYPGVMLTHEGPKIIEYNARFGDPEAQGYMRLLKGDLLKIIMDTLEGDLDKTKIEWSDEYVTTVTLASKGYPGKYDRCQAIEGIEQADQVEGAKVYHGGTARIAGETIVTGGRVLHVTALGRSPGESKQRAYQAAELINFDGKQQRDDIGSHTHTI